MNNFYSRLARNSLSGLFRYAITIPILLAITPFILRHLGPERYGVWAIFGIVTGYADLSDLGITSTLVRFVAQQWAVGDERAISRSVSTVQVIYLVTGGLVAAAIFLGGHFLADQVFKVPAEYADEAIFVITGAAAAFFILLISGGFGALVQGVQRMDLWNARIVIYTIVDSAGIVIVLALGLGLRALVINRIVSSCFIALYNYWTARRLVPSLTVRPALFDWASAREIVGYSVNILVSKIAVMAREPLNKTFLLWFASLSGVTYFDLGSRIANQARGIFSAMLTPLLPASSGVQTSGGPGAVRQLFYRSTRYVALAVLPFFGGLVVMAKPIILLWIGPGYDLVILTMQALLVAYFFVVLSSPAYSIMEGIGLAKMSAVSSVTSGVLNIVLTLGLGFRYGYLGVLAGVTLAMVAGSILALVLFHRKLETPFRETLRAIPLRALLFDLSAMVAAGLIVAFLGMQGILALIVPGCVYLAICLFGTLATGCLNKEEIASMRRLLFAFAK